MHARDYRRLAYFVEIAQAGSLRAAARRLGLSAPVLSLALSDLEAELGVRLAVREARRFALTDDGRRLYVLAADMVDRAARAMAEFQRQRRQPSGPLHITLPSELCVGWLPGILADFEARYPEVNLSVTANDAFGELTGSPYDLALRGIFQPDARPGDKAAIPVELRAAPHLIRSLRQAQRMGEPLPLIGFTRHHLTGILAARRRGGAQVRLGTRCRIAVNNGVVARDLARQGLGATLVLRDPPGNADGLRSVFPELDFGAVIVTPALRDARPTAAAQAFLALVRENLTDGASGSKRPAR